MAIFKAVGSATIKFNLSSSQRELDCWDMGIWALTVWIFSWCTYFGDRDNTCLCWWSSSSTSQWLDRSCSLSSQSTGFSRYCFNLLCAFLKLAHATTDRCYPRYLERKRELICGFCMVNLMRINRTSCIPWTFVSFLCYRFSVLWSYLIKASGTLVSGANTIVINVISGSAGDGFLWAFCTLVFLFLEKGCWLTLGHLILCLTPFVSIRLWWDSSKYDRSDVYRTNRWYSVFVDVRWSVPESFGSHSPRYYETLIYFGRASLA